jgi:hypothetical protein
VKPVLVPVALAVALAVSACSSSSTSTATSASAAGSSTSAAATAGGGAVGDTVDATGVITGMTEAMKAAKTGKMTMTSTNAGAGVLNATSEFEYTDTSQNQHLTMDMSGMSIEMVVLDGVMYLKGMPTSVTGGKAWVKIDPNGTDALSKQLAGSLSQMGVDSSLAAYQGAKATLVDTDGGGKHYRVDGLTLPSASTATGSAATAATTSPSVTTADFWLDSKGLPLKSSVTVGGLSGTVTVTYSGWGAPVTITAPPADQVGALAM